MCYLAKHETQETARNAVDDAPTASTDATAVSLVQCSYSATLARVLFTGGAGERSIAVSVASLILVACTRLLSAVLID